MHGSYHSYYTQFQCLQKFYCCLVFASGCLVFDNRKVNISLVLASGLFTNTELRIQNHQVDAELRRSKISNPGTANRSEFERWLIGNIILVKRLCTFSVSLMCLRRYEDHTLLTYPSRPIDWHTLKLYVHKLGTMFTFKHSHSGWNAQHAWTNNCSARHALSS